MQLRVFTGAGRGLCAAVVVAVLGCATRPAAPPVAPVAPSDATARLDAMWAARWRAAGVAIAPDADDGEFLRRVTLDLVGRVPTLAEAEAFLAERATDKRARLVDRLLASPELGEHFADLTADLLFGGMPDRRIEKDDPRAFLVTAFNENRRYDRLVTEILTATGSVRDNGATAFIAARARAGGGPEAVAGAAARIFLGLQIQCAHCHDHPYDPRWKQADFHALVGYFARTRARRDRGMEGTTYELIDLPRGEARMRAPGSTADVVVPPRFLGRPLAGLPGEPRRVTFARAVVGSDLFAKALVGRIWAQLFGAGLVDPWDDLGAERDAKHPPELSALADEFRASGFDVKRLLRAVVLSRAYGRSSAPAPGAADDGGNAVRVFARARVRPLTPEQLFRSLLVATGADGMLRERQNRRVRLTVADIEDMSGGGAPAEATDRTQRLIERGLREYRFTFEDDEMADADFDGTMPQALLLLNGELTNNGTRAGAGGVLASVLASTRQPRARLERLFLAAYARRPSPEEAALFAAELARTPDGVAARKSWEDVYFALLTSTEAITNH